MTESNKRVKGGQPFTREQADRTRDHFSTAISYITIEDDSIRPKKPEHVFYMHFIQGLRYIETIDTPLAGVMFTPKSATGNLFINPKNASNLALSQFAGLIVHELLHIVFGHVHIESEERKRYPKHCNVAMDMAINQIVLKDQYKLPWGKGIYEDHPDLEVEPCLPETVAAKINEKLVALGENPVPVPALDESYEFYLVWLLDALKKIKDATPDSNSSQSSEEGESGQASSRDIADQLLDELDEMTDHDAWEEAEENMSQEERELVKRFVAQAAQEAANSSGGMASLPGHVQAAVKNLVKVLEPKMDWGDKIREFAGGCGKLSGFVRTMRENKHGLPGLFSFKPGASVGLVVDTSGSVTEQEFGLFMAEAIAISKTYDMEVFVLETSYGPTDEVWSITESGVQDMYARVGYGGTNMRPGIEKFLELNEDPCSNVSVGGIIVLSDGELGEDSIIGPEEIDIPLLWAFTRDIDPFKNRRYAGEMMYFDPKNKTNAKLKS